MVQERVSVEQGAERTEEGRTSKEGQTKKEQSAERVQKGIAH